MPVRLVCFAGTSLAVEYHGKRPAAIVEFLCRDLFYDDQALPLITFRLLPADVSGQLHLYQNDELVLRSDSEAEIANVLLGKICYYLAYFSQGGLLFHAGGVARQNKGMLLPGAIGAGKTTLIAWLVNRGFDYLTDEMVFVPPQTWMMHALTRPLNIKPAAGPVLRALYAEREQPGSIYRSDSVELVSPTVFNPNNQFSQPPLSLIVFPRYRAGHDFMWQPLSKAQAGLELMKCLVNARNLPEHGFAEIACLARSAPAFKMTYAGFEQIEPYLEKLIP